MKRKAWTDKERLEESRLALMRASREDEQLAEVLKLQEAIRRYEKTIHSLLWAETEDVHVSTSNCSN